MCGEGGKKLVEKYGFTHWFINAVVFAQNFALDLHGNLHEFLHNISTLTIDTLLNFLDLVTEVKVEFEVFFNFLNAMHDCGMVFDANFSGDFGGTET